MKVTLIPNLTKENAYASTLNLCSALDSFGIMYDFYGDFSKYDVSFKSSSVISSDTDVIIAIGGDGTMIRAAKAALPHNIPVLGINAGTLAFLVGLENDEVTLLKKLITGDYTIEERMVLDISIFNKNNELVYSDSCINDAVFARGAQIKIASFDLFCDGKFVSRYKSDGIILATPTGSTAYNLSAGGPIVDPKLESILLTPICPHSLEQRTIIFNANSVLKIENPDDNKNTVGMSCDGNDSITFCNGYFAEIKKSTNKIKLIRLKDDTFMDILNSKMKT
ncbi:MAG: NAD(+)/NADH kinase [Clostridia bacterium]|nr:NAD(+)/NADH kinase [Clostridia bacterium]